MNMLENIGVVILLLGTLVCFLFAMYNVLIEESAPIIIKIGVLAILFGTLFTLGVIVKERLEEGEE